MNYIFSFVPIDSIGGAEKYSREISTFCDIKNIALFRNEQFKKVCSISQEIILVKKKTIKKKKINLFVLALLTIKYRRMVSKMRLENNNLIFNDYMLLNALPKGVLKKNRVILIQHSNLDVFIARSKFPKLIWRILSKNRYISKLVTFTEGNSLELSKKLEIEEGRFFSIRPYIPAFLASLEKKDDFLFVGRIDNQHKGISHLVKVANEIYPDVITVIGDGPDSELIKDVKNIKWLGAQSPNVVREKIASSRVLLITSTSEGYPFVAIEAMTSGVPVVAFDTFFNASEIIKNGINGFLVKPFDYIEYGKAIQKAKKIIFDTKEIIQNHSFDLFQHGWLKIINNIDKDEA